MAKKKLKIETADSGAWILGLLTPANDYKITWLLNQNLHIELKLSQPLSWQNKKLPAAQEFVCFSDTRRVENGVFLVKNISKEGLQIPEYKGIDFILIYQNPDLNFQTLSDLKTQLKGLPQVRGIFELDPSPMDGRLF